MNKPIIEAIGIGKKYNITHQRGGYVALRDVLTNVLKNPFRFVFHKTKQIVGLEKKEEFWALADVNFNVARGEVIGIIGRNGAGKSTLLKILSQITPPTTGEVIIKGTMGSLLEVGTGFHPELTGRENIMLNGAILGMAKKEIVKKFDAIVEFAGIDKFLDTPVKHYSSGMYVRLAFSVAAHLEPDILLVDEVLAVGDAEFQKKCLGKMDEITKKEGRTILFVSHNLGAIESLCHKTILLKNGKIEMFAKTSDVINHYLIQGKDKPINKIEDSQHLRKKSGMAEDMIITQVTIKNKENVYKNNFLINEDIVLDVEYEIRKEIEIISFWLFIYDKNNNPIVSSYQKDIGPKIENLKIGSHKIRVKLNNFNLLPGHYNVTVGAYKHDTRDNYRFTDWVDQSQSFEIINSWIDGKSFDNRPGIVNTPADWINIF